MEHPSFVVVEAAPGGAVLLADDRAHWLPEDLATVALDGSTDLPEAVGDLVGPDARILRGGTADPDTESAWTREPWTRIGRWLARALDDAVLDAHGVGLLDRHRRSTEGRWDEAATATAVARRTIAETAELVDGELLVLKGIGFASQWPLPCLRPVGDVDVLADDAPGLSRRLLANGWTIAAGASSGGHHGEPLRHPDHGVLVEPHDRPYWMGGLGSGPAVAELFERAEPGGAIGLPAGVVVPDPAAQAVLAAVHAWQQRPIGRARDVVDLTVLRFAADDDEATATARAWGALRLWDLTRRATDCVIDGHPGPTALRPFLGPLRALDAAPGAPSALARVATRPLVAGTASSARAIAGEAVGYLRRSARRRPPGAGGVDR